MRLLMISGDRNLVRGKMGAFYNTLEEFHRYWDRIDIICPNVGDDKKNLNFFGNVFVHPSPWPLVFQPRWILKKGTELFKEVKFDLITVHEYPPFYNGLGTRLLWNSIRVSYVLEIHHIPGYPRSANLKEELYKNFMRIFIEWDASKAKAVRVVNQGQVPSFLTSSGIPKEKILYIPSVYLDQDVFRPLDLPKEYDLIFIGRLEKNKGLDLFLEVVKKLNCKAVIVGDGTLKNYCKLKIENWKLQDKVLLYGWAKGPKEIAELLNKSKILVMPSYNEGGPRVVVEAMACGVPVLATPVGIVPDLLKNGLGGAIITWAPDDIARQIKGLLDDPERYQKLSRQAVNAAGQFEKKEAIKNYVERLQALIR